MKRELPELVPEEPFRLFAGRLFLCRELMSQVGGIENGKHHYPG
jgi:hypothetical protein